MFIQELSFWCCLLYYITFSLVFSLFYACKDSSPDRVFGSQAFPLSPSGKNELALTECCSMQGVQVYIQTKPSYLQYSTYIVKKINKQIYHPTELLCPFFSLSILIWSHSSTSLMSANFYSAQSCQTIAGQRFNLSSLIVQSAKGVY